MRQIVSQWGFLKKRLEASLPIDPRFRTSTMESVFCRVSSDTVFLCSFFVGPWCTQNSRSDDVMSISDSRDWVHGDCCPFSTSTHSLKRVHIRLEGSILTDSSTLATHFTHPLSFVVSGAYSAGGAWCPSIYASLGCEQPKHQYVYAPLPRWWICAAGDIPQNKWSSNDCCALRLCSYPRFVF